MNVATRDSRFSNSTEVKDRVQKRWGFPTVHTQGVGLQGSWTIRPETLDYASYGLDRDYYCKVGENLPTFHVVPIHIPEKDTSDTAIICHRASLSSEVAALNDSRLIHDLRTKLAEGERFRRLSLALWANAIRVQKRARKLSEETRPSASPSSRSAKVVSSARHLATLLQEFPDAESTFNALLLFEFYPSAPVVLDDELESLRSVLRKFIQRHMSSEDPRSLTATASAVRLWAGGLPARRASEIVPILKGQRADGGFRPPHITIELELLKTLVAVLLREPYDKVQAALELRDAVWDALDNNLTAKQVGRKWYGASAERAVVAAALLRDARLAGFLVERADQPTLQKFIAACCVSLRVTAKLLRERSRASDAGRFEELSKNILELAG